MDESGPDPMLSALAGDNRIAAWAWTGLSALNSNGCASCNAGIRFTGQLFSGVSRYYDPETANTGGSSPRRRPARYRSATNAGRPD